MANYVDVSVMQTISCVKDLNDMRIAGELRTKPGTAVKLVGTGIAGVGGLIPDQAGPTPIGKVKVSDAQLTELRQNVEDLELYTKSAQAADPVGSQLSVLIDILIAAIRKWFNF